MKLLTIALVFAGSPVSQTLIARRLSFSNSSEASHESTSSLLANCSFAGPSWDPLQDCFSRLGSWDGEPNVRKKILCKLKKDLQLRIHHAWLWSDAASIVDANASIGANYHEIHPGHDKMSKHETNLLQVFDSTQSASHGLFPKCAVVSNSGVLRLHRHGAIIDASDLIIRFNDAPLHGLSDFVGNKDETRIVNNQFPDRVLHHSIPSYVFQDHVLFGLLTFSESSSFRPPGFHTLRSRHPESHITILHKSLMESVEQTLREIYHVKWFHGDGVSFKPTTGSIGMLTAMATCDEVSAFGMAATPSSAHAPYHYYPDPEYGGSEPDSNANENNWHKSFNAEKDLWRRIAKNPATEIDATDIAVIPGFTQFQCP